MVSILLPSFCSLVKLIALLVLRITPWNLSENQWFSVGVFHPLDDCFSLLSCSSTQIFCLDFLSWSFTFPKPTRQGSYLNHSWGLGLQAQGIFTHRWAMHVAHVGALSSLRHCASAWDRKVPNFHLLTLAESNI